jgi:hypothetical protein
MRVVCAHAEAGTSPLSKKKDKHERAQKASERSCFKLENNLKGSAMLE